MRTSACEKEFSFSIETLFPIGSYEVADDSMDEYCRLERRSKFAIASAFSAMLIVLVLVESMLWVN